MICPRANDMHHAICITQSHIDIKKNEKKRKGRRLFFADMIAGYPQQICIMVCTMCVTYFCNCYQMLKQDKDSYLVVLVSYCPRSVSPVGLHRWLNIVNCIHQEAINFVSLIKLKKMSIKVSWRRDVFFSHLRAWLLQHVFFSRTGHVELARANLRTGIPRRFALNLLISRHLERIKNWSLCRGFIVEHLHITTLAM